jgi:hypothetical protein
MNSNVKNYVKKTINPYLRDVSITIPLIQCPNRFIQNEVEDISAEFGYNFESMACDQISAADQFRRITNDLANKKKSTVLFLLDYDSCSRLLLDRVSDYLQNIPGHVKVVLGKFGAIPEENKVVISQPARCICPIQDLCSRGCSCQKKS